LENEIKENAEQLSEEQVFDILEFANALSGGTIYPGILTPMLVSQRFKDITMNPMQATETALAEALKNPKNSEEQLQAFSQDFENQSQIYKRLLSYLGDMLSFDLNYSCINADKEDYKTPKYKKDFDIMRKFFDNFDYKKEFAIAVKEILRNEAFFCSVRFDSNQIALQELPSSPTYTMITGRTAETLLFDFNMYWFIQPGVDINMYPPFFKKKYAELFKSDKRYEPALPAELRGTSSWIYWQSLPIGSDPFAWCFKFNPEIATRLPYFSALFPDLVLQSLMRSLQKSINMSVAARLVAGEIGTLKDTQSKNKDQFNISAANLGNFLNFVKSAIGSSLNTIALPLSNVQALQFSAENDVYSSSMRTTLGMSGINSNLIYTNENRTNAIETQLSIGIDEMLVERLYPQFNAFLNYHINRMTKNFKFRFEFEGTKNFTNRQQRLDRMMTLGNVGIVLPNRIAAAVGIDPFTFQRELEEAQASGWVSKLTPLIAGAQAGKDLEGGRPKKSETELGDSGDSTRSTGGNVEKGGKL
jgi:hypothetical protein